MGRPNGFFESAVGKYTVAVLAVVAVVLIRLYLIGPVLGQFAPLLIFIPAVAVAAWFGGIGPGLLATAMSGWLGALLFIEPFYVLAFDTPNLAHETIFLGSGLIISLLCEELRKARRRAEARDLALQETDRRKNEFLATLAHELRNPLAPIRHATKIARMPNASETQRQWAYEVTERQIGQMARLLDDLLEASRISRGKIELRRERTDLSAALMTAIEAARPLIESRQHVLTVDVPEHSVWLDGDPVRLAQIFTNLLTNAAKYTDPQGRIALRATVEGRHAVVSVRDNGMGISPEMLPRLFHMFSQATSSLERSEGGLGIGLALAKGLVHLHGGSIEARSEGLGKGCEFVVRLPITQRSEGQATRQVKGWQPSTRGSHRVLVADDNRDSAESLAMVLRLQGVAVEVAHDGRQALALAGIFHPDIVLLDIGMPGLNGYEVARQIRSEPWGKDMKVIAVTGWGQDEDKLRAREAGFDLHLTKPIDPDQLDLLLEDPEE